MAFPTAVRELAQMLNGTVEGEPNRLLRGVAPLDEAGPEDLTFAAGARNLQSLANSLAGCVLVDEQAIVPDGVTAIRVRDPRAAFANAVRSVLPPSAASGGVHATAVLGEGVKIGKGTAVGARCVLGDGVSVGDACVLHPGVTVLPGTSIGNRVILHSGCVLGADGFGFVWNGTAYEKFPQVGTVIIEDDVEIGANSCVDRAALGRTVIGAGSKLDNLVHIGHNCRIGKHVVIAAQTGLAGGVVVEDRAVIGGQVGIGDKARILAGAVLASKCGVLTGKIVRAGEAVWGIPARPLRQYLTQLANVSRLPELAKEMRAFRKKMEKGESL